MRGKSIRAWLIAGLVVWLPILATFFILRFLIDILDGSLGLLPLAYQPEQWLGVRIPGLGVISSFVLLIGTGMLATNFLGQRLVSWSESIFTRIPLVRTIYNATKQVSQAVFGNNGQAFRKVVLIEYPRKGVWTLAFLIGAGHVEASKNAGESLLSVFVPTTPNPTSGFLLMLPEQDVTVLNMSVDTALKYIISLGVVQSAPREEK